MSALFKLPKAVPIKPSGVPYAGAKAFFFFSGTVTPADVFTDADLTIPHASPVVADSAGVFEPIYYNPSIDLKLTLNDSADALIYTVDPVNDSLTQALIGAVLYPRTASEVAASVTPTNYPYPEGHVYRYGTNTTPGTTDMQGAVNAAVSVKAVNGGDVTYPDEVCRITATIQGAARVNHFGGKLLADNCDGITLDFRTTFGSVVIADMDIQGVNGTTRRGIAVPGTTDDADELFGVTIQRNLIRDFNTAVYARTLRRFEISDNWFQGVQIGMDLRGKNLLGWVHDNLVVFDTGNGAGTPTGVWLDLFNYTTGTGNVGPEGLQFHNNQFFGFDTGLLATFATVLNFHHNDLESLVYNVDFSTVQQTLNITDNYCELSGSGGLVGIYGRGLASTLATKVNIQRNGLQAVGTSTAIGIKINDSGNQNQNYVTVSDNWLFGFNTNDILFENAGHGRILNNYCASTGPTNSIAVPNVIVGSVFIDMNLCAKAISWTAAEAASGEVILGVNTIANTTLQYGSQQTPTVASAAALTLPLGSRIFHISGTTSITSIVATGWGNREVMLIFDGVLTFTDGSNLKLAGNLVTTADDTITLACDGTNWFEVGRAVN